MNRRKFLSLAGVATSYSVLVRVDGLAEAGPLPLSREDISKQFDAIAPSAPSSARFAGEPNMTLVDQQALATAQAATQLAAELLENRRAMLDSLQSQIAELGKRRHGIGSARSWILSEDDEAALARKTLDAFLANFRSESPATASAFTNGLLALAHRTALAPHVLPFVLELETAAERLACEIRDTATREKFNLKNMLAVMKHEAEHREPGNLPLLRQFEAGVFADLAE